jgi:hypothetical protein
MEQGGDGLIDDPSVARVAPAPKAILRPTMNALQRGWIVDFANQHESFFRSKGLCGAGANAYKMLAERLYG